MEKQTITLMANGLRFVARTWGEGPLALLLHGFPDDADSWTAVAERLAAGGLRAVAPFMRGYAPTEVPERPHSTLDDLADDVAGLVAALGGGPAYVVGHDWGAVAAYAAARTHPEAVRRVVGLSVPPLDGLVRSLPSAPAQLGRSAYMLFFQAPGVEALVRARDFAFIAGLWRRWSPGWTPPPERLAAVKHTLAQPGTLTAALGYYRGLRTPALARYLRPLPTPVTCLVGARDGCMAPAIFARAPGCVVVPDAGHFLPLEAPEVVADHVLAVCPP